MDLRIEAYDYCGRCDKPLNKEQCKPENYCIVQYNYPTEPDEYGYLCSKCMNQEIEDTKAENEYFEGLARKDGLI